MPALRFAWPLRGRAADVAVTGGVALIVVGGTAGAQIVPRDPVGPGVLGWALVVIGCAAVWFRGRHPVAVVLLTLAVTGGFYLSSTASSPLLLTFVVALYTASAEGYVVASVLVAVLTLVAVGYGELVSPTRHVDNIALFMLAGWLVAVIAVGAVKRNRQAYLAASEARAVEAERSRDEEARRRQTEERLRIARELHDALGHNLSMIHVQASAALHGGDPAREHQALEVVKQASKEGLRELRSTLGVLRQVDEVGLAQLGELAERARGSGLRVNVDVEGTERPVTPQIDLAAYRIVQEALTNVVRHANASAATVRVRHGEGVVRVEVQDDGTGGAVTPGNGIQGMGERARLLGGEFSARSVAGGFLVTATLPVGKSA